MARAGHLRRQSVEHGGSGRTGVDADETPEINAVGPITGDQAGRSVAWASSNNAIDWSDPPEGYRRLLRPVPRIRPSGRPAWPALLATTEGRRADEMVNAVSPRLMTEARDSAMSRIAGSATY